MTSFSSISQIHNYTVVSLDLPVTNVICKSLIANLNSVCDKVEDIFASSILWINLQSEVEACALNEQHSTVEVGLVNQWERALRRLERLETTSITTINGNCNALSIAILLTTDYRIAAYDSCFRLANETAGIMPDMTLYRLANQIGVAAARRFSLFAANMTATEALQKGLLDELADETAAAANLLIKGLKPQQTKDIFIRRRLLLDSHNQNYDESVGLYLAACDRFLRESNKDGELARHNTLDLKHGKSIHPTS